LVIFEPFFEILQAVLGIFQATFLLEETTFLRELMVGIASINGSNCSLGREFFFSGQGAIFS
jgi:hypothetical protein